MRSIGFCNSSIQYRDDAWSNINFETVFQDFCNSLAHQAVEIFITDDESNDEDFIEPFENVFKFIEREGNGFLVVIPDATHIASDLEGVAKTVIRLEKSRSEFYCLEDDYPDILQNAFAHFDAPGVSMKKSQKIRKSMQIRAMEGKSLGKAPYGYQISNEGTFLIDQEEAKIVHKIFNLYTETNLGLRKIVEQLNNEGIKTRRGNTWNIVSIRDILRNTFYIGTYTRFGLRLTKNHEPIIETELFRDVQDKTRERRIYRGFQKSLPYLLSGLCKCGYCGNHLMGVSRKQSWKRDDGTRMKGDYRYYQCQSKGNKGTCSYHTWRTSKLEDRVLELVRNLEESGELMKSVLGQKGDDKRLVAASKRLKDVELAEGRFIDFMRKTAKGQSVIGRLTLYLEELELARQQAFISVEPNQIHNFLNSWEKREFAEKKSFLNEYLNSITVKDRSVRIHL